jgi:membrane protein
MKKYLDLFKQTFKEFGADKAPRLGAALAYYAVFSIAPLLLIAVAIAGLAFGQEAAMGKISAELSGVMGPTTAKALEEMVQNASKPKSGIIATVLGVITLLMGASGVFGQLKDALNTIWNVEAKRRPGIMGFIRDRFLSMGMVFAIGFLLLITLVVDAAISGMSEYLAPKVPGGAVALQAAQLAVSFALVTVLFALIFRFLPDAKVEWHDVWLGAIFTSLLFVIGKFGLGLYLGKSAAGSAYGAAGSLVILLLWVYYSAQILFFGAEFTQVYARTHGSMIGDTSKSDARQEGGRVEDRPKSNDTSRPQPARVPAHVYRVQTSNGGGAVKLAAGGAAGLFLGTLVGGLGAALVILKGLKKVVTLPLK